MNIKQPSLHFGNSHTSLSFAPRQSTTIAPSPDPVPGRMPHSLPLRVGCQELRRVTREACDMTLYKPQVSSSTALSVGDGGVSSSLTCGGAFRHCWQVTWSTSSGYLRNRDFVDKRTSLPNAESRIVSMDVLFRLSPKAVNMGRKSEFSTALSSYFSGLYKRSAS